MFNIEYATKWIFSASYSFPCWYLCYSFKLNPRKNNGYPASFFDSFRVFFWMTLPVGHVTCLCLQLEPFLKHFLWYLFLLGSKDVGEHNLIFYHRLIMTGNPTTSCTTRNVQHVKLNLLHSPSLTVVIRLIDLVYSPQRNRNLHSVIY